VPPIQSACGTDLDSRGAEESETPPSAEQDPCDKDEDGCLDRILFGGLDNDDEDPLICEQPPICFSSPCKKLKFLEKMKSLELWIKRNRQPWQ
jgi:hypothetical protein